MAVYTGRTYAVLLGEYCIHMGVVLLRQKSKGMHPFDAQHGGEIETFTIGFRHGHGSFHFYGRSAYLFSITQSCSRVTGLCSIRSPRSSPLRIPFRNAQFTASLAQSAAVLSSGVSASSFVLPFRLHMFVHSRNSRKTQNTVE